MTVNGKTAEGTIERRVIICNRLGLHARAAGKLRNMAAHFRSHIEIVNNNMTANAKSVLGLMALEGYKGVELTLRASGEDADDALAAIAQLIEERFGEED